MINNICYISNQNKFYNPFLAFNDSAHRPCASLPEFSFMPGAFRAANIEPLESFASLCDRRAKQIRDKYDIVVLAFSGGTDSYTMYDAFVRNNIFIDQIVCSYMETPCGHDKFVADWLVANHTDPRTKLTIVENNLSPVINYHEEWVYDNHGINYRYRAIFPSHTLANQLRDTYQDQTFTVVSGYDKPHLILNDNEWYMTFLDSVFSLVLGVSNQELFYITPDLPELHIKQCHMLAKWLTPVAMTKEAKTFFTSPLEHGIDYMAWSRACGRIGEVLPNNSVTQKIVSRQSSLILGDVSGDLIPGESPMIALLSDHFNKGNDNALRYLAGYNNLQTDRTLTDYLINRGLISTRHTPVTRYTNLIAAPIRVRSLHG